MAIPVTAYLNFDSATLQARLTAVQAEITRQLVAGASFGTLNRNRSGVTFEVLSQMEAALQYAINVKAGTLPTETVMDMSVEGP